ncbi:MAG: hypothetical protein ABIA93_07775 [Candidatus Woesearchaeota archaeon]
MNETTFRAIENRAMKLQSDNTRWHFHMLTPECKFNESNKHAFVLEDRSSGETFVVYSEERNMALGKKLVAMLHGDKIVEEKKDSEPTDKVKAVLARAKELAKEGKQWHHHMLFPDCALNKHAGKWNIIFENPNADTVTEILYDDEPKADLNAIEVEYYSQKN